MAQFYPRHYLSSLYSIGIVVSFQTYYEIWLYLKGLDLDHLPNLVNYTSVIHKWIVHLKVASFPLQDILTAKPFYK